MYDFSDRSILITGGAGDLGSATAEQFLRANARVTIVDIDRSSLDATVSRLEPLGELFGVQANVTVEEDVQAYVAAAVGRHGPVDVFFNNAGIEGPVGPFVQTDVAAFEKVMAVNVRGAFLGLKHVLPLMMQRRRGSVINTSSVAGLDGTAQVVSYVTSKHALVGLTKVAALEAAPFGVRVNSIHPSSVQGRMMRSLEDGFNPGDANAARKTIAGAIPLGSYAQPADVARLVAFLASDDSSFITGAQYRIDGGKGAA